MFFFCLFGTVWCFLVVQRILLDLTIFIIQVFVLAFKNIFPLLYFCCRLFISYVDTHVESSAIKINSVAICSRSKFNLTGLIALVFLTIH